MKINIKKLHRDAIIPKYETSGAAGFDLVAIEDLEVTTNKTVLVPTGLAFEIPEGFQLEIRPRSGISVKTNLMVTNSPGTVDSDYRGEVKIAVRLVQAELGQHIIKKGERIAQGVIMPVYQAEFVQVEELSDTERGEKGFGSTGIK